MPTRLHNQTFQLLRLQRHHSPSTTQRLPNLRETT